MLKNHATLFSLHFDFSFVSIVGTDTTLIFVFTWILRSSFLCIFVVLVIWGFRCWEIVYVGGLWLGSHSLKDLSFSFKLCLMGREIQSDLSFSFNKLKIIQISGNSSLFLLITNNEGKKIRNGKSTTLSSSYDWFYLAFPPLSFLSIFSLAQFKINHFFHATFSFSQLDVLLHNLTRCTRQPFVSLTNVRSLHWRGDASLSSVANTHFLYALMWRSEAQNKTSKLKTRFRKCSSIGTKEKRWCWDWIQKSL